MVSETPSRTLSSDEELSSSQTSPGIGSGAEERPAPGRGQPKGAHRGPQVNAISPTRQRPRARQEPVAGDKPFEPATAAEGGAGAPASSTDDPKVAPAPPPRETHRADTDPWAVPSSIRDRFVQEGHQFYFPDGAPAFRDLGHRLTTASENTQVVHSLIEIGKARGWTEVTVSGTERFRQDAWRQARLAGLTVRGYRPSEPEQAALIRAMASHLARPPAERQDTVSAEVPLTESRAPAGAPSSTGAPKERIVGRLLDHGREAYRHDPKEEMSYFMTLETREGKREIWGIDLERALTKSLTQPQLGDEVVLHKSGRDVVTVKRIDRDSEGRVVGQTEVDTHRNRWVIEKSEFFAERARAAQVVRDATIDARTAVRAHPELAGTYLNLRAGELAAQRLRDAQDQRRFVALLRAALADEIERGEPLQPVRLRERARSAPLKEHEERKAERGFARG